MSRLDGDKLDAWIEGVHDRSPNSPYADPLPECPICRQEMDDSDPQDCRVIFWPDERLVCADCYWRLIHEKHRCYLCGGDLTALHKANEDEEMCVECAYDWAVQINAAGRDDDL